MEIHDRLNLILKEKNITKAELSRLLPFDSGGISNYCSGKEKPGKKFLLRLQEKLNVNPAWVIYGQGSMFLGEEDQRTKELKAGYEFIMENFNTDRESIEEIIDLIGNPDKFAIVKTVSRALNEDSQAIAELEGFLRGLKVKIKNKHED